MLAGEANSLAWHTLLKNIAIFSLHLPDLYLIGWLIFLGFWGISTASSTNSISRCLCAAAATAAAGITPVGEYQSIFLLHFSLLTYTWV